MLSRKDFNKLAPYGYSTKLLEATKIGDESYKVLLHFTHKHKQAFHLEFSLPLSKNMALILDGAPWIVIPEILPGNRCRSKQEVCFMLMTKTLERTLADYVFRGAPVPDGEIVEWTLKKLMTGNDTCLFSPSGDLEADGFRSMVRLRREPGSVVDAGWRLFRKEYWGALDPNSTSQSVHINQVYRFATNKKYSLSATLNKNAIALRLNPYRAFLLRTAIEGHLTQVTPEPPLVKNPDSQVTGKTLYTAIMDLGTTTFEDAIPVSRTAASVMSAYRDITETVTHYGKVNMAVKVGDVITPRTIVATSIDETIFFRATKIYVPSKLVKVTETDVTYLKRPAKRFRFHYRAIVSISTGDKICGLHGNKGIAWIVGDRLMPTFTDPKTGLQHQVDMCISPVAIRRRYMSMLWEMMASRKAVAEGMQIRCSAYDTPEGMSFEDLVKEGWGSKTQLYLGGHKLPEETFVAPLFWIRLNKLAVEQCTAVGDEKTFINHVGLPINSSRQNGQRRDISKAIAMNHRGLNALLEHTTIQNSASLDRLVSLVKGIEPNFSFKQKE